MTGLNTEQLRAVHAPDGPLLVIACAGSGKTRVLTHRVMHLIDRGVPPERILLLTFTRRAAREMIERAAQVHPEAHRVEGGTFHSFALRMVQTYHRELGLTRRPTVIDPDDAETIIATVTDELEYDQTNGRLPSKAALQELFSLATNRDLALEAALEEMGMPQFLEVMDEIKRIRVEFAKYKLSNAYVDFDDLLLLLRALLNSETLASRIRRRYDHVLIDEFQDTNHIQGQIALALAKDHNNLMVVGDDAQGIYSWRGARIRNILEFPKQFDNARVINLEDNYRSTQAILDTANAVLAGMRDAYSKSMRAAARGAGEKPRLHVFLNPSAEAAFIADRLQEDIDAGKSLSDTAVLYRAGAISYPLQAELTRRKIPFVVHGGSKLTDAQHVKDVLAYLRVLHNPEDELAWIRLLQLLPRIGPKTARRIFLTITNANATGMALLEAPPNPFVRLADLQRALTAKDAYREALGALVSALDAAAEQDRPVHAYDHVLKHYATLMPERFKNPERRMQDLDFLRTLVSGYSSTQALLDDLTLDPIEAKKEARPPGAEWDIEPVVLSTIHSAKGLEWSNVYLIGVNDGVLPSHRALRGLGEDGTSEALEEEKRLLYVAITRAMHRLDVCFSFLSHLPRGQIMHDLSRFLSAESVAATLERVEYIEEQPAVEIDLLSTLTGGLTD